MTGKAHNLSYNREEQRMSGQGPCIQVLDCGNVGLKVKDESLTDENIRKFGDDIKTAFSTTGFCYLQNHGIDKELIEGYMQASRYFFALSDGVKQMRTYDEKRNYGWAAVGREKLNPERPSDLNETFSFFPTADDGQWPGVEEFLQYNTMMYEACTSLTKRLLHSLSVGLGLDKDFLTTAHKSIGTTNERNTTMLRSIFYPPITDTSAFNPGQIRLGEHSDYGTIALLFQDDVGGLEAEIPGRGFVPVTPIPDTIVVNVGDLMQRWTSDALKATSHRVVIPADEFKMKQSRQSAVFFVHPDVNYVVKPLDGSDKYKPVCFHEYLLERLSAAY